MIKTRWFILAVIFYALSRLGASEPSVPETLRGFVTQVESVQGALIHGRGYLVETEMIFSDGSKKGYLYDVKKYDATHWIITHKNMIFGSNDRYLFIVEKTKENTWRKLAVLSPKSEGIGEILGRKQFDALNPLTSLEGRSIAHIANDTGFEKEKIHKGDINELTFESYQKARSGNDLMSVKSKILFREAPNRNFSYIERLYNGSNGGNILKSERSYQLSNRGEVESIHLDTALRLVQNDEILQKEVYKYTNFHKATVLKDTFLAFYGLPEPSDQFYPGSPWYLSFWFLGGTSFAFVGGLGYWFFRSRT